MITETQRAEYLHAIRLLMAEQNAGYFIQGDGQEGIANEALVPFAIEGYNKRHPEAPIAMPDLALTNFTAKTGLYWIPGYQPPVLVPGENGNMKYAWSRHEPLHTLARFAV